MDDQMDEEKECPLEKAVTFTGLGLSWEVSANEDSKENVLGIATCYLCKRNKNNTSYVIPSYPNKGLEPRKLTISAWQISFPEEKGVYRYWLCNECWLLLMNIPFLQEVDGVRPDVLEKKRVLKEEDLKPFRVIGSGDFFFIEPKDKGTDTGPRDTPPASS